jgi:imidazole glycerol-phosphate synthase subunit HisH
MNTVIIKYNAGNIKSVELALERLGITAVVSDDPETILTAHRVILPGVGEASSAMSALKEKKLDEVIRQLKQPFLGICLGMQLLAGFSEENNTDCLGILDGISVKKFCSPEENFKIPQVGWNNIEALRSPLFRGIKENSYCYFVHSFYMETSAYTIAESNYIDRYSAAVNYKNFYGVQFHPEKSAETGEQILKNFLNL